MPPRRKKSHERLEGSGPNWAISDIRNASRERNRNCRNASGIGRGAIRRGLGPGEVTLAAFTLIRVVGMLLPLAIVRLIQRGHARGITVVVPTTGTRLSA